MKPPDYYAFRLQIVRQTASSVNKIQIHLGYMIMVPIIQIHLGLMDPYNINTSWLHDYGSYNTNTSWIDGSL
uniref:Uncharacterized protein n=1 Tax=Xenopus tropicalis TaxID=8364 RepID=A0A1B8YA30_XENTR